MIKQITEVKLFMLNCNTQNHLTEWKPIININRIIRFISQYLKPFNCVQTNEFGSL